MREYRSMSQSPLTVKGENIMKSKLIKTATLAVILLNLVLTASSQENEKTDHELYQKAKRQCIEQEWEEAIHLFQRLIEEYPDSQYRDDAHFWIGYCLGKRTGSEIEAFITFENLISDFKNSPWVDDAVIHQIALAEKLVRQGREQFLYFLIEKLNAEEAVFRQQAALALGRLNDKRALPELNSMKGHEDLGPLAQSLIERIESEETRTSKPSAKIVDSKHLRFDVKKDKIFEKETRTEEKHTPFFHYTKRHRQYRDMLKKKDDWTKEELIDFGMWQILPTDQFEEYNSLQDYDRSEWLRKYWKQHDPTPTTETNEARTEFERRVNYARAHFSDLWNYRHLQYLMDQHLREGWPRAPWDARGEMYIKYGEPDARSVHDYHEEEWIYYGHMGDFIISQYMTNIYGEAIRPGEMSQQIYQGYPMYVDANFIYNQEFVYEHDYDAEPLKKFKWTVENESMIKNQNMSIHYSVPTKEFKLSKENEFFVIQYLERYVILDEDMREIYRHEKIKELKKKNKRNFKKEKHIKETITLDLEPGHYIVALRIEDQHSNKLGIFQKDVIVRD